MELLQCRVGPHEPRHVLRPAVAQPVVADVEHLEPIVGPHGAREVHPPLRLHQVGLEAQARDGRVRLENLAQVPHPHIRDLVLPQPHRLHRSVLERLRNRLAAPVLDRVPAQVQRLDPPVGPEHLGERRRALLLEKVGREVQARERHGQRQPAQHPAQLLHPDGADVAVPQVQAFEALVSPLGHQLREQHRPLVADVVALEGEVAQSGARLQFGGERFDTLRPELIPLQVQ
mmetsp:Transcript_34690/g.84471  ORF Transcript_34690/g.84471 Transcript_34690/m.84471 type:complete len:231 (-) Transcript_34690:303-995(-)